MARRPTKRTEGKASHLNVVPLPVSEAKKSVGNKITPEAVMHAAHRFKIETTPFQLYTTRQRTTDDHAMFEPAKPLPGVVPEVAMDDAFGNNYAMLASQQNGGYTDGTHWLGFPYLSELAQRAEYRMIVGNIAREMTRSWIKIHTVGVGDGTDKSDKIKVIEDAFRHHEVQDKFRRMAELDGFFGRAHLYIDTGISIEDREHLTVPIIADARVFDKGMLKNLKVIEPIWTYPGKYNAQNPMARDFYVPTTWYVMSREVHKTRLLTFVGREVPDLLKPAYAFGGLSMSQMAKPYVDNWLRTRQSVSDLIHSFSVSVLKTNMSGVLSGGGGEAEAMRAMLFNTYRDNRGLFMLDKETEEFDIKQASLGTLDHLQAQSQEHMSSVSGIPLVIMTGITPSGLNPSSEGELQAWAQTVSSLQKDLFYDHLMTILELVQLDKFGEIDPSLGFTFNPLKEESDEEKNTKFKSEADAAKVYVDMGAVGPDEIRQWQADKEEGLFGGLDLSGPPPEPPQMEPDPLNPDSGESPPGGPPGQQPPPGTPGVNPFDGAAAKDKVGQVAHAILGNRAAQDADFEENDHPRDKSGKFAKTAGGASEGMAHHAAKAAEHRAAGRVDAAKAHENAARHYGAALEHHESGDTEKSNKSHSNAAWYASQARGHEKKVGGEPPKAEPPPEPPKADGQFGGSASVVKPTVKKSGAKAISKLDKETDEIITSYGKGQMHRISAALWSGDVDKHIEADKNRKLELSGIKPIQEKLSKETEQAKAARELRAKKGKSTEADKALEAQEKFVKGIVDWEDAQAARFKNSVTKIVNTFEEASKANPLTTDTKLYRLTSMTLADFPEIGKSISFKGITSTSKSKDWFDDNYEPGGESANGKATVEIEAPKGTPALDLNALLKKPPHREAEEIVLPPSIEYEVTSIDLDKHIVKLKIKSKIAEDAWPDDLAHADWISSLDADKRDKMLLRFMQQAQRLPETHQGGFRQVVDEEIGGDADAGPGAES